MVQLYKVSGNLRKGKDFLDPPTVTQIWKANAMESWVFQQDGIRVINVDFTTGSWEGFPSEEDLPRNRPFRIQAIFSLERSCDV